jgi:hypothetical protein
MPEARETARLEPRIAPTVAPAARKPNSRLPWVESNTSTISAQKTDTTNRLNTDTQMKNALPTQTSWLPVLT